MASVQKKNNNLYVVYRKNLKEGGQSKPIYEKQPTKDEAKAKLRANYINELFRWDKYADPADPNDFHNICALDDLTLGHFLDLWVPIYAPLEWSYSSYINNLLYINKHIKPDEISKIQIRDLTPTDISAFLGRLAKKRNRRFPGGSPAEKRGKRTLPFAQDDQARARLPQRGAELRRAQAGKVRTQNLGARVYVCRAQRHGRDRSIAAPCRAFVFYVLVARRGNDSRHARQH